MAVLQSSNVRDLRQKFYELLTDFSTFPASQNFFLVNIKHIPASVTEASVNSLGLRPGTGESTGLDFVKNKTFKKYFDGYMFLATGIDLTTETTTVDNRGKLINGLLPVGPFMESRNYPDNDLDIQFSETNISLIDSIFRSWIQLYSVYGNMADVPLSTDVSIYFISKQTQSSYDSDPVITKIYTYKDCIPYVIKSANVAQYNGDVELGSVAVGWRFSKYDVRIPVLGHTPDPPALSPATPEISPEALKGPGYDFTGEVPIYPPIYPADWDENISGTIAWPPSQSPSPSKVKEEPGDFAQPVEFYPTGTNQYGETTGTFLSEAQKIALAERARRMSLESGPAVPATRAAAARKIIEQQTQDLPNRGLPTGGPPDG